MKYCFPGCSLRRAKIIASLWVRLTDGHPHCEKNKGLDGRVNNQVGPCFILLQSVKRPPRLTPAGFLWFCLRGKAPKTAGWPDILSVFRLKLSSPKEDKNIKLFFHVSHLKIHMNTLKDISDRFLLLISTLRN